MFSIADIVAIAVQLEKNGEQAYRRAARAAVDPSVGAMLERLADEEGAHARWFSALNTQVVGKTAEELEMEKVGRAMLRDVIGNQHFSLGDVDLTKTDLQHLLATAAEFERDTVLFYEMIRSFLQDEETLEQLDAIIEEERSHLNSLQERMAGLSSGGGNSV